MDKIIKFCGLVFIVFVFVFLRQLLIGYETIWFNVIFVSVSLVLIGVFAFSKKEEKYAKISSLILFFITLTISVYISTNSYYQKITCNNYSDYECVAKIALKRQDVAICDLAKKDEVSLCYRELSRWWNDASVCEKIKVGEVMEYFSEYYDCIANIAKNTNNPSLCEKINYGGKYSPNKSHCYARFNNN